MFLILLLVVIIKYHHSTQDQRVRGSNTALLASEALPLPVKIFAVWVAGGVVNQLEIRRSRVRIRAMCE